MKFRWLCSLLILSTACASAPAPLPASHLLDGSAVEWFWSIQDRLLEGQAVEDAAWEAMFATPAFRWAADSAEARGRIEERMRFAFRPGREALEAEIETAEGGARTRWRHYMRMRDEREELGRYFEELLASDLMGESLAVAQKYLPPGSVNPADFATPVRFLLFWPDAFADGGAVYLDLIEAKDHGDRLKLLLAHEFHHDFYQAQNTLPELEEGEPDYWVLLALVKLHMEGLADRIDKGGFPLPPRPGGAPGYAEDYNRHYVNAEETLQSFDAALKRVVGADDRSVAGEEAWKVLHYSGHVEGFFMANVIAEALGEEALLLDIGDPFAFLRRFQSVHPTFSAETLAFLDGLEVELRR